MNHKVSTANQRAQIDAGVELEKASKDEAVKRYEILVDAATKLLISRREQETEVMKVAADAEQRANEAVLTAHEAKGAADAANAREQPSPVDLSPMMEAIASLVDRLNAPREIVRDPKTGRAMGVRTVQ